MVQRVGRTASAIIYLAERGFTGPLDERTKSQIGVVLRATGLVDGYIDALSGQQRKQTVGNILGYLKDKRCLAIYDNPELCYSLFNLRLNLRNLPPQDRSKFLETVKEICELGEAMSLTTGPKEFMRQRELEAGKTGELVTISASKLGSNEKFCEFFTTLGVLANTVDTFVDAYQDKADGKISIQNPASLQFHAAKRIVTYACRMVRVHHRTLPVVGHVGTKLVMHKMRKRLASSRSAKRFVPDNRI